MSPIKVVPIPRVTRRKVEGKLDVISVECPECRRSYVCNQTAEQRKQNEYPVANAHECETYNGPLYFLNVADADRAVVIYGADEYNQTERASISKGSAEKK